MQQNLLDFFQKRSNIVKEATGFTSSGEFKTVALFTFKVSNFKTDNDNTIELGSLELLNTAVKDYYGETVDNFKDYISISEVLKEDDPMFVHLQLP